MKRKYLIIIEKGEHNFSAYVLDLPGLGVCGDSIEETKRLIREAIDFHIEGLIKDGEPVPEPTTESDYVVTAA